MDNFIDLLHKYGGNTPRYTSYPAVPHWKTMPSEAQWLDYINQSSEPFALYIHLPFCSKLCSFCACNKIITSKYEGITEYIDLLIDEAKLYSEKLGKKLRINNLHVGGGTPTFVKANDIKYLFDRLNQYITYTKDAELSFEAHPVSSEKEKLQAFYDAGFRRVSFGIQDFNPKVQEAINRIQSFELSAQVLENARAIGYNNINFDFIYGLPFQTAETITETFESVIKLMPERIAFYGYAHLPENFIQQRHVDKFSIPNSQERHILQTAGRAILQASGYVEIGMDHFALPHDTLTQAMQNEKLTRNFMGYTLNFSNVIIPLGISSIGNTAQCFVQNVKDIDSYKESLCKANLPIAKGHVLTDVEKSIQGMILNLMTKFCISLTPQIAEKLKIFEEDGLVIFHKDVVKVTEKGRPFLRAICAKLDGNFSYEIINTSGIANVGVKSGKFSVTV